MKTSKIVPRPGGTLGTGKRENTRKNRAWLAAVASLENCVLCGRHGVQVAHRNEGKGMALKNPDHLTAALCPECHHEIDNGHLLSKDERRAEMDKALVRTFDKLVQAGKVGLV